MNESIILTPEIMLVGISLTVFLVSGLFMFMLRPKKQRVDNSSHYWEYQYPHFYLQHASPRTMETPTVAPSVRGATDYRLPNQTETQVMPSPSERPMPSGYSPLDFVDEPTRPVRVYSELSTNARVNAPVVSDEAIAYLLYQSGGQHLPEQLTLKSGKVQRIGRSQRMCELYLDDIRVSRNHALIRLDNQEFYIRDEGSSGGTSINQRKLKITEQYKLSDGDLIGFNEVYYKFHLPKSS